VIPFNKNFTCEYGAVETVSPLIRRVVANNPGPFTFTGTGTFIIGHGTVAVIDPGPDCDDHLEALKAALQGETVSHIFVTHHHLDHSPLSRALKAFSGAKIYSLPGDMTDSDGGAVRLEAGDDVHFSPDVEICDGTIAEGPGWTLEALHTPGHTSGHLCFALHEENALFCGDHVMAWSTSIVSPPDGHMGAYLASLHRILDRGFTTLFPTHGPAIHEPEVFIRGTINHRLAREKQVVALLKEGPSTIRAMVAQLYADVEKRLHPAAAHMLLAHMIHLTERGVTAATGSASVEAEWRLVADDQVACAA
jgi:glyoxylase-like metal-dependent hydrolase (beta-lactamase superfamily II)